MYTLLSPAKRQDFSITVPDLDYTLPQALPAIKNLITELKKYKSSELKRLMAISEDLAQLNYERFQNFSVNKFNEKNAKPAIFAFQGDVYRGLGAHEFNAKQLQYAQQHLGVLSGLYGLLRPLDLMQPYRLEMKTQLKTTAGKDLYAFWDDKITQMINEMLQHHKTKIIINLASQEYFKAVKPKILDGKIIHVDFKEKKNNKYQTIGLYAKYARGLMAKYIIQKSVNEPQKLQDFAEENYRFNEKLSEENRLVFTR
jgi:uncharacterized protein